MSGDPLATDRTTAELLRDLEHHRLRALVDGDLDVARRLHADDYELVPPGGRPIGRTEYLESIASGAFTYDVFEPASDIRVRTYRDAAIIRYLARIEAHGEGWRDRGHFWHTDLYELRDGRWLVVWSQATRVRDEPEA